MTTDNVERAGRARGSDMRGRRARRPLVALALVLGATMMQVPTTAATAAPTQCVPQSPGGPMWVTADCVDPLYADPVIDTEGDETSPVVHHKVSGHFEGTDIRFNIYLPPAEDWEGRFFQYTYPLTDANADNRAIGFAASSGGYAVQAGNSTVSLGYRHAAAAAKFAKTVAADYYGSGDEPIHGYLYGASGGSFQTIGAMENTIGVWDGFVPMVMGVPMSAPYTFFIRAMARLLLADKAQQISEAVLPGGSGRPYAGLDAAERSMLHELTAFGVPLRAWENPDYLLGLSAPDGLLGFGAIVRSIDPSYADDFWHKPGYLGTEQSPLGDAVRTALAEAGDTVDNRWDIALRSYYRHQLPPAADGYYGFDQFRTADGAPLYPQRAFVTGPAITRSTSGGAAFNGKVTGKVIVVDNLYDVDALPWHADWYARRVKSALGDEGFADRFRLYYNDHADHLEEPVSGVRASYLVNYYGIVEQALRDVADWAERGVPAPLSTQYTVNDADIDVPPSASSRLGIQPVVDLTVRGSTTVHVDAGNTVSLRAEVETPPSTGKVVAAAWDFDGDGSYASAPIGKPKERLTLVQTHRFGVPGVYFVAVRVTAQRGGTVAEFAQVQNLDRVRVVVH